VNHPVQRETPRYCRARCSPRLVQVGRFAPVAGNEEAAEYRAAVEGLTRLVRALPIEPGSIHAFEVPPGQVSSRFFSDASGLDVAVLDPSTVAPQSRRRPTGRATA
jgi:hypothetical protein